VNISNIAKRSIHTLWTRKHLWFFGFFVASASGGGGGGGGGAGPGAGFPAWLIPVIVAAGLLGLVALVMNVLSEAALIRGVHDDQDGEALGVLGGLREGRRHFVTVLVLKVLAALGVLATVIVTASPLALGAFELVPMALAAILVLPLVLFAIPVVLTITFLYEYALRFAVLEGMGTRDAIRASRRFLHGRLADSIRLTLLAVAGHVGGGLVGAISAIPGAAIGLATYFAFGLVPGVVVGALLVVPFVVLVQGATGTFRSSVWTLGFMEARG